MPKRPTAALDLLASSKKKGKTADKPKSSNTPISTVLDRLGMGSEAPPTTDKPAVKAEGFRQTVTDHHTNGSHTVRHIPRDGGDEVTYAVPDLAGVHKGFDKYLGEPKSEDK